MLFMPVSLLSLDKRKKLIKFCFKNIYLECSYEKKKDTFLQILQRNLKKSYVIKMKVQSVITLLENRWKDEL